MKPTPTSKIVHQVWFNFKGTKKGRKPPKKLLEFKKRCMKMNKGWEYMLWDEKKSLQLLRLNYPWFIKTYETYPNAIQRTDAIRYFILDKYGGFYMDFDIECLKSFDQIRADFPGDVYFAQSANSMISDIASNCFMYSNPKTEFFQYMISNLKETSERIWYQTRHMFIMDSTGPKFLTNMIRTWESVGGKEKIGIFPAAKFNPYGLRQSIDWDYREKGFYTVHHGLGSWEENDSNILKDIFCNIELVIFAAILIILVLIYGKRINAAYR